MNKKAFTLIELLVVVLIIGILAAIALPQYQTAVDKANYTSMMAAVRALKNEQELYYLANGQYTTDISELSGVFPAECDTTGNCKKFWLRIGSSYVYGALDKTQTGIRNSFLMWNDGSVWPGRINCYAYIDDNARGRKLCASSGGVKSSQEDNGGCDGSCTIYEL